MAAGEYSVDQAIREIVRAPFHDDGWDVALKAIASLTGSWGGQLIAQRGAEVRLAQFLNAPAEALAR